MMQASKEQKVLISRGMLFGFLTSGNGYSAGLGDCVCEGTIKEINDNIVFRWFEDFTNGDTAECRLFIINNGSIFVFSSKLNGVLTEYNIYKNAPGRSNLTVSGHNGINLKYSLIIERLESSIDAKTFVLEISCRIIGLGTAWQRWAIKRI